MYSKSVGNVLHGSDGFDFQNSIVKGDIKPCFNKTYRPTIDNDNSDGGSDDDNNNNIHGIQIHFKIINKGREEGKKEYWKEKEEVITCSFVPYIILI